MPSRTILHRPVTRLENTSGSCVREGRTMDNATAQGRGILKTPGLCAGFLSPAQYQAHVSLCDVKLS